MERNYQQKMVDDLEKRLETQGKELDAQEKRLKEYLDRNKNVRHIKRKQKLTDFFLRSKNFCDLIYLKTDYFINRFKEDEKFAYRSSLAFILGGSLLLTPLMLYINSEPKKEEKILETKVNKNELENSFISNQKDIKDIDILEKESERLLKEKQYEKAIPLLKRLIKNETSPSLLENYYSNLGKCQQELCNIKESKESYLNSLKNDKYNIQANTGLIIINSLEDKNLEIYKYFENINHNKSKVEESLDILINLTENKIRENKKEDAKRLYKSILLFTGLKYKSERIKSLDSVIKLNYLDYLEDGEIFSNNNKWDLSEIFFKKAIELNKNDFKSYFLLANCQENNGQSEEAIKNYRKVIDLNLKYAPAYYNLGIIYIKNNSSKEALSFFKKAVELDEKNPDFLYFLAICQDKNGKNNEAIKNYRKVIDLNPKSAVSYNNLACCLCNQGNYKESIKLFKKSIELDENSITYNYNLANTYINHNESFKSIHYLEKLFRLFNDKNINHNKFKKSQKDIYNILKDNYKAIKDNEIFKNTILNSINYFSKNEKVLEDLLKMSEEREITECYLPIYKNLKDIKPNNLKYAFSYAYYMDKKFDLSKNRKDLEEAKKYYDLIKKLDKNNSNFNKIINRFNNKYERFKNEKTN